MNGLILFCLLLPLSSPKLIKGILLLANFSKSLLATILYNSINNKRFSLTLGIILVSTDPYSISFAVYSLVSFSLIIYVSSVNPSNLVLILPFNS